MEPQYLVVTTMCSTEAEAETIARLLLEQHLIAAGQIGARQSLYWWDDQLHERAEWELNCMTQAQLYPAVEEAIKAHHSYEVAQVIATPVVAASASFTQWITQYTSGHHT